MTSSRCNPIKSTLGRIAIVSFACELTQILAVVFSWLNFSSLPVTFLRRTSSTSRCGGFTKSFPSLVVSSYSAYSLSLDSSFLQNLLYPFFPSLLGSSFKFCPLYSSSPGYFGVTVFLHSYNVTKPSQLCSFCNLREVISLIFQLIHTI
jgi:hypothetical protein